MRTPRQLQPEPPKVLSRGEVVEEIEEVVTKRGLSYGQPEDNFLRIARYWQALLMNRYDVDVPFSEGDVADMMVLVKMGRLDNDPLHHDSGVDVAGYAVARTVWASRERAAEEGN